MTLDYLTTIESLDLHRPLISVEYPGLVADHNGAIKTLGGIGALSLAHSQGNRK